ncbi:hypothetical protein [Yonghaparkia sp. Root332]|uniref:hypothetical protein n=1 Tax=Yonghaparkia sp. Root332 TaxID=1736516 RepID=UPI0012E3EDDE|nr:hypothetical protein [Yonghaparkia sp. Root332]
MSTPQSPGLTPRLLPDSVDSRLFVELASYAADLLEASAAIDLAFRSRADDGPLDDATGFLIGYAAMAYCRTYFPSKVRRPMTDYVSIPTEHGAVHALITDYRNRRVAHSHSQLASTFAVIVLDANGSPRPGVFGLTTSQVLPPEVLDAWAELITVLSDRLGELQNEVEARLNAVIAATDREEIRRWPAGPAVSAQFSTDFTARDSRSRYPDTWTEFWSRDD